MKWWSFFRISPTHQGGLSLGVLPFIGVVFCLEFYIKVVFPREFCSKDYLSKLPVSVYLLNDPVCGWSDAACHRLPEGLGHHCLSCDACSLSKGLSAHLVMSVWGKKRKCLWLTKNKWHKLDVKHLFNSEEVRWLSNYGRDSGSSGTSLKPSWWRNLCFPPPYPTPALGVKGWSVGV